MPRTKLKLWLSPLAKQHQNPLSGPPLVYQDLSMRHAMQYDWPVEKAISIVDLPIKMNGNSKHTSCNSLSQLPGVRGGGAYCHIWAIQVCAAVKGMVFKQFTLG